MLRYRLIDTFAPSRVRLVIGSTAVEARLAAHPLFSQVKQIQLRSDELNLKCLQLIQKGEVEVACDQGPEFTRRCREAFGIQLELICEDLAINLMLGNSDQDNKTLDSLDFNDLLSVVKSAFDKNGVKLHAKILRKLKNYAKASKRKQSEKNALDQIVKSYKESEVAEDQPEQQVVKPVKVEPKQVKKEPVKEQTKEPAKQYSFKDSQDRQQKRKAQKKKQEYMAKQSDDQQDLEAEMADQVKPRSRNTQRRSNNYRASDRSMDNSFDHDEEEKPRSKKDWQGSRSRGGRSNDKFQGRPGASREKKYDAKIMLGISGDTEAGWRERNRPIRVPKGAMGEYENQQKFDYNRKQEKRPQKRYTDSRQEYPKPQSRQQKRQPEPTAQSQKTQPQSQSNQPAQPLVYKNLNPNAIFVYPKDGQTFNFNKVKDGFSMLVNGSFWVSYSGGSLEIKKGENGYVRDSKIDVIGNGFMAEGLTISLGGSSNIEDGGDAIGNPTIQDFTGTQSQFFHVITLEIFPFGEHLKAKTVETKVNTQSPSKTLKEQPEIIEAKPKQENKQEKKQEKKQQKPQIIKKEQKKEKVIKVESPAKKQGEQGDEEEWEDQQEQVEEGQQQEQVTQVKQKVMERPHEAREPKRNKEERHERQEKEVRQHGQYKKSKEDWQDKGWQQRKDKKIEKYEERQDRFEQKKSRSKSNRSQSRGSQSSRGSKGSNVSRGSQKNKMDKLKIDPKILKGINGDTEAGWRQANRPAHGPPRQNLTVEDSLDVEEEEK